VSESRATRPLDLEHLRDLAAAGASDAAMVLSRLLVSRLIRRAPRPVQVTGVRYRGDPETPALAWGDDATGVFFLLGGGLHGMVAVLFTDAGRDLAQERLVGHVADPATDPEAESALDELANILVSHVVSAMADRLKQRILPSVPELGVRAAGKEFLDRIRRDADTGFAIGIENDIADGDGQRLCSIVVVPAVGEGVDAPAAADDGGGGA